MLKILKATPFILILFIEGCGGSTVESFVSDSKKFGEFTVQDDETTVVMNDEINSASLTNFNSLLSKFPNVNQINIVNSEGSSDDEINLLVSKVVHDRGIKTHLNDGGIIASGGVDFFLAGLKRTRGTNTKIGVHSWSDGTNQASDFPEGHENHLPYIEYYKSIGFNQQEAEEFYYFTINAAPADDIHFMSDAEIIQFGVLAD